MLNDAIAKRVSIIDKVIIPHSRFNIALQGINDCVLQSRYNVEAIGCLLVAQTGLGKTTLCRTLLAKNKRIVVEEDFTEKTRVPAFYFEIPAPARISAVAIAMLDALGAEAPKARTPIPDLTKQLIVLLEKAKTELVLVDEFHNLFGNEVGCATTNKLVRKWIKGLVNRTKISFCLMGHEGFENTLSAEEELARRFPLQLHLKPLFPGDERQAGELVSFLSEAIRRTQQLMDFSSAPNIDNLYKATQFYAATGGNPSYIMSLIRQAAIDALCSGSTQLTMENFANAWDSGMLKYAGKTRNNPFRISHGQLSTELRGIM